METYYPHHNSFTRIRRSSLHGIGVFAILNIPKGMYVFEGDSSVVKWFSEEELQLSSLPEPIKDLYDDFCIVQTRENLRFYGCPDNFNNMPISWYLNRSDNPNMGCDKDYNFYTLRDIVVGEELTTDYCTYSE